MSAINKRQLDSQYKEFSLSIHSETSYLTSIVRIRYYMSVLCNLENTTNCAKKHLDYKLSY